MTWDPEEAARRALEGSKEAASSSASANPVVNQGAIGRAPWAFSVPGAGVAVEQVLDLQEARAVALILAELDRQGGLAPPEDLIQRSGWEAGVRAVVLDHHRASEDPTWSAPKLASVVIRRCDGVAKQRSAAVAKFERVALEQAKLEGAWRQEAARLGIPVDSLKARGRDPKDAAVWVAGQQEVLRRSRQRVFFGLGLAGAGGALVGWKFGRESEVESVRRVVRSGEVVSEPLLETKRAFNWLAAGGAALGLFVVGRALAPLFLEHGAALAAGARAGTWLR